MVLNILFIGPAGSGKTSLTHRFGTWLEKEMKASAGYVNLDPGCRDVPYCPGFDIRKMFTIDGLMEKRRLGPNGAMILASELMRKRAGGIIREIRRIQADIRLVDTPGQMEIFVFRPAGPAIVEALQATGTTVVVYIVDPTLASSALGLVTAFSLAISTQFRLEAPTVTVLNKSDRLKTRDIDKLLTDLDYLRERIVHSRSGVATDLALRYVSALKGLSRIYRIVRVSAKTGAGMGDLYDICREALCVCGEM